MENELTYIDVILPLPVRQTFTYHLTEEFTQNDLIGKRVIVQFGQRKFYSAPVKTVHHNKPGYDTKPIEAVLDQEPVVLPVQFRFWEWMAQYYYCSEGEVMRAALPSGLKLESRTIVSANPDWDNNQALKPIEGVVLDLVSQHHQLTIEQINKLTRRNNSYGVIQTLLQSGAILLDEELEQGYRPRMVVHLRIASAYRDEQALGLVFEQLKRAGKQLELLMLIINELNLFTSQPRLSLPKKELLSKGKFSEAALNGLIKRGVVELLDFETDRLTHSDHLSGESTCLNPHQTKALHEIHRLLTEKQVVLLHGVTASGKTEIYIRMIGEQLKAGKQVLYLLPEIALTSQIIERLRKVFGPLVGIYHSKFNDAERTEIWNKVLGTSRDQEKHYQLILGARSALFLPYRNLGLVIVDEEHDPSFKQSDPAPRYQARDAAVMLATLHGAKVLLGTATPSFESYFNTQNGKFGLVRLTTRHHDVELPRIIVSDLKQAYRTKETKSLFTPLLLQEINGALERHEQIILFQNRRGFSSFLQCKACGYIPKCRNCDVSLTYHKFQNILQCHYCGATLSLFGNCPQCQSSDVKPYGVGTEKVEDDLHLLFPEARIDRLDLDSTRNKFSFERILNRFTEQKTDILVGTQMITKGLDFEHVSIVGILNADSLLNFPDFRAYERAFQLMSQVSGRAGRKHKQGKVIIQTFQSDHPVIDQVVKNDYEGFFFGFINERQLFQYPPWYRLISITIKHQNNERVQKAAGQLGQILRNIFKNRVLGPEYPLIARVRMYYQMEIRIKFERQLSPDQVKKSIAEAIGQVSRLENNSSVLFAVDVDPY